MKVDHWFESLKNKEVSDFVLRKYIGHGKIGYVYKATNKIVRKWEVAIKLIPGRPRTGWDNELKKVSQLSKIPGVVHLLQGPGPVQISHERRTEIFQYTVWDYIAPGRNLHKYLGEVKTCPTSFLVAVIEQILRVLHACYAKKVKHGDLHAGNILIGEKDDADLDSSLLPREPIYISDFGYGTTGGTKKPKDDYLGLAQIVNTMLEKVEWDTATVTDRQILKDVQSLTSKLLRESSGTERQAPLGILQSIGESKGRLRSIAGTSLSEKSRQQIETATLPLEAMKVGQFQVSEMLGDDWKRWKQLFVSTVPAKSRILEPDIFTVVTGPRGCGKTMLFRRLSERLMLECGPIDNLPDASNFVGLYVNANDIADAFAAFPTNPSASDMASLICYANLCILSDLLAVQSARLAKFNEEPSDELFTALKEWLVGSNNHTLVAGENSLEHYRSIMEKVKWKFPTGSPKRPFPGFSDLSQHAWLPRFIGLARGMCRWISSKTVFIFIDDYTTPRVSQSMQRVLNRLFLQRSSEFVCKIATESATTFLPEDSSRKILVAGDDYQLIDIAEESLFMTDKERALFLNEVFSRRLSLDSRVHLEGRSLSGLLGDSKKSKTEFARLLRQARDDEQLSEPLKRRRVLREGEQPSLRFYITALTSLPPFGLAIQEL
jgi:serine/threonine protein kinase